MTPERNKKRREFGFKVEKFGLKIQVGARGQKFSEDWTAIDLYDSSDLIDHQWDLHDLPLSDNQVDCFVCNAVLEHVPYPELAVSEMFRTLKLGGQIWIEVPFLQFEHGHPMDFTRWTPSGLELLMNDFENIATGISDLAEDYTKKFIYYANVDAGLPVNEELQASAAAFIHQRELRWKTPRIYSGCYFWGEKQSTMPEEKVAYMKFLKGKYLDVKPTIDHRVLENRLFG